MSDEIPAWNPFRPTAEDLDSIAGEVAEISAIQKTLLEHGRNRAKGLRCPDRTAHQYQIAGGKVLLKVDERLPAEAIGVGLFQPGAEYVGVGRISTGLGTPHAESNPDFLGLMLAFQTHAGDRVDFLAINDPGSPADNHRDFVDVLFATGESAGAQVPVVGNVGRLAALNLGTEQVKLFGALTQRMGALKAGAVMAHIYMQTWTTFRSSTAYQPYWTGVYELSGRAGKFTLGVTRNENHWPGPAAGERRFSNEWSERQRRGDIEFTLYWIPFLNEATTPLGPLTRGWKEAHKQRVGVVSFPRADAGSEEAILWSTLASEIGANPGNWVCDAANSIREPSTAFGCARKIAYRASQAGRNAIEPHAVRSVFESGAIDDVLAQELRRRRSEKAALGHVNGAM